MSEQNQTLRIKLNELIERLDLQVEKPLDQLTLAELQQMTLEAIEAIKTYDPAVREIVADRFKELTLSSLQDLPGQIEQFKQQVNEQNLQALVVDVNARLYVSLESFLKLM